jgi:hypothetical protein
MKQTERLESDTPFKKLLEGEADSHLYVRFLIQTDHYVKFTPTSLRVAADRLNGIPPAVPGAKRTVR